MMIQKPYTQTVRTKEGLVAVEHEKYKVAEPLSNIARIDNYVSQSNRNTLTSAQLRRFNKKHRRNG